MDGENPNIDHADEINIFNTVMEAQAACEVMDTNSSDDVYEEPIPDSPFPSDVQKVASTIVAYLIALEEPYAHKLEGLSGQMRWDLRLNETRALKPTKVTDFFH